MVKAFFILASFLVLLVSCASTGSSDAHAKQKLEPEKPLVDAELAALRYTPGTGYYFPIQRNSDMRIIWFILKKQISRHSNYYWAGYDAEPGNEQLAALFIRDLITDDYPDARRCVLYLNGKCMLLLLSKEEIKELTSAYSEEQSDYIFDVVYKMAYLLFNQE